MAILGFGKDKPQARKHSIVEVIRTDMVSNPMPNDILIWKFPNEDFNTNTQLIVGPSQEAIFVKGGQVLGNFIPGTYTLSTKNYPFLRQLVNMVTGGVCPFSCSVYYVNKVISMGINWGTDSPIRIIDPHYGVPVNLTGYGDFSLQVENGRKLLEKLVGVTLGYSHDEIQQYFSNLMAAQVRSVITGIIVDQQFSLYGIDSKLLELSSAAQERVAAVFEPYGLAVNHFVIAKISYSGLEEIEEQIAKEAKTNIAHGQAIERHRVSSTVAGEDIIIKGRATAEANRALGFSAKEQAVAQMGTILAGNVGPNVNASGAGILYPGIIGGGTMRPASTGTSDIAKALLGHQEQQASMPSEDAGGHSNTQASRESFEERTKKVKFLLDNGFITQEQYKQKMDELLNEI